jgi:hypothetical protein
MRNILRSAWVGVLVSMLVIDPALACRNCGQSWGYYAPYQYSNSYERSYGSPCCSPCPSCGGEEVVVSEPCGCQSCGCEGQPMPSEMSAPRTAPQPPAGHPTMTSPAPTMPAAPPKGGAMDNRMPSTVNKPMEPTPAPSLPQLPAKTMKPSMGSEPSNSNMAKPVAKPATPPQAAPAADDLFGAPTAKPSDTGSDLFGGAKEDKPAPSKAAPATESNLPKLPAEPALTPPAEKAGPPAADDLFGPSASEPAAPSPIKSDAAKEPAMSAPAEGEKAAPADKEKDKKKDDDLFGGFGAILREPGGLSSNESRHWVDDTGRFSCDGRLARVMDGRVELLKENGHTSTVLFNRLSQLDLAFVNRQASAEKSEAAGQTAQYTSALLGQ